MPPVTRDGGGSSKGTLSTIGQRASNTVATAQAALRQAQGAYRPPVAPTQTGQYVKPVPSNMVPGSIGQIQGQSNAAPSLESFLGGDTGYQNQLRQFQQALNDFLADVTRRRGTLETDFGTSKKAMGDQRVKDLDLIEDDFGARGLLTSGLYGKAVGDYESEYNQRLEELTRRNQEALAGLQQEEGTFKSQQQLKEQAAKEGAIRRRAEQFGL